MVETYLVICILAGLFGVFSVLFINAVTFEKVSNCKIYRYFHIILFVLICCLFIVNLGFYIKIKLEKEVEWDNCCYKENEEFEKKIIAQLEKSNATLWKDYVKNFNNLDDASFMRKMKNMPEYLKEISDFENFKSIVSDVNHADVVSRKIPGVKAEIEKAWETFKAQTPQSDCFQVTQDLKDNISVFDNLATMTNKIKDSIQKLPDHFGHLKFGTDQLSHTYLFAQRKNVRANIKEIGNHFNKTINVLKKWRLAPRVDSNNPKWLSIVFYVSSALLIIFNAIPIIPFFMSKKPNSSLKIVLAINHYLTIVTLIILATMLAVCLSFDIIKLSQKYPIFARDKFKSSYSVTFIDGMSNNNLKQYKSVCVEPEDTFLKDIRLDDIVNFDDIWRPTNYSWTRILLDVIVTSSEGGNFKVLDFKPEGIEEAKKKVEWFVERWLESFDKYCFNMNQIESHYGTISSVEGSLLDKLDQLFDYYEKKKSASINHATKILEEYVESQYVGLQRQLQETIGKIHNSIHRADFSCRKIVEAENKCQNSEVRNFLFFTSMLFAACFLSIFVQTLPNPWIIEEQEKNPTASSPKAESPMSAKTK